MAIETVWGDGRDSDAPLAVVPLGPDGEALSASNPTFVQIADGTNAATVLRTGAGQSGLMVVDRQAIQLLVGIYSELKEINQKLTR